MSLRTTGRVFWSPGLGFTIQNINRASRDALRVTCFMLHVKYTSVAALVATERRFMTCGGNCAIAKVGRVATPGERWTHYTSC